MDEHIDALVRTGAARAGVLSLGGGLPARELFPRRALTASFLRVVTEPAAGALQYGWPEGSEPLRAWVAQRLRQRGASVEPGEVIITSGAQQALTLIAEIALPPGTRVACDPETYPAALDLFRARGLHPTTEVDGAAAFYTMPAVSNPRGLSLSAAARRTLLARARAAGAPILEDDAYAELRFDGRLPPPLLAEERALVHHVGTFSKTLCPGLRVGWLISPPDLHKRALAAKQVADLQANSLAQALLEDFLAHADYDALLARARRFYARRARLLAQALARALPALRFVMPEGGLALWAESAREGDDAALLDTALRHGVSVDPGRSFRVDGRSSPLAMRISFAGEAAPKLVEGVERLARAWREVG